MDITAARSQEMTDGGEGMYRTISGTSMATPHVAGAAAILAQQHPDWTGAQLKEHLMSSAKGLAEWYSPYEVGTGRLDVAAAVRNTVSGTGSLFFGNYDWPHEPTDVAVTKDLVFTNHGSADVTLNLALTSAGGPFTLGASTVTVPAGGKATVPVTGDPRAVDFGRFTRLRRRHRRGHRPAGDPYLRGADQGGRAVRPEHQARSAGTASPPPAGSSSTWPVTSGRGRSTSTGSTHHADAARHLHGRRRTSTWPARRRTGPVWP